ncbi:hypothetical protein CERSUDRAFT_34890, partial [Gelatoporia subvermispora B]
DVPFLHQLALIQPTGEVVRMRALFDDGAMINAMCSDMWQNVRHRLGQLQPTRRQLRMANGSVVPSEGYWEGTIELAGARVRSSFDVFSSGGSWSFLAGKPLLRAFKAVHNYATDQLLI